MQAGYRTILSELLLVQSAALGAFADVSARCTSLMAQQYQVAAATFAGEIRPNGAGVRPPQPGTSSGITGDLLPGSANFCRGLASLPWISMMSFLARYDGLRGRRSVV